MTVGAEPAPVVVGLGSGDQDEVGFAVGGGGGPQGVRRPREVADRAVDERDVRSLGLEVDVLLLVDGGELASRRTRPASQSTASLAASAASFHPVNAATTTGSCRTGSWSHCRLMPAMVGRRGRSAVHAEVLRARGISAAGDDRRRPRRRGVAISSSQPVTDALDDRAGWRDRWCVRCGRAVRSGLRSASPSAISPRSVRRSYAASTSRLVPAPREDVASGPGCPTRARSSP